MDQVSDYLSFLGLKKKEEPDEKAKPRHPGTLAPLRRKHRTDEYMSRVDVEDHIVPIWERETEVPPEKEPLEDMELKYSYSLLSFVSRSLTEGTVSSYETDQFELLSESDVEENEVRGVYLHELQRMFNAEIPSPDAYPVYIKGVTTNGSTVECFDASPYAQQFPVILYEWFIGLEYNSLERYSPEPLATGKTFTIPIRAIGKYVFCRAHRLVEAQLNSQNMFSNAGTYDPHTHVFQTAYPGQKKLHVTWEHTFQNISTMCSAGPVDISNDLALKLLENLSDDWAVDCTLCYNKDLTSSVTYENANLLKKTLDVRLEIGPKLAITFSNEDRVRHAVFDSDFFAAHIKEEGESEGRMALELPVGDIEVRESNHSETEILVGMYEDEKLRYYFSLKFEDRIQCVAAIYTVRCHIAQQNAGLDRGVWAERLSDGDLDFVAALVRDYLAAL